MRGRRKLSVEQLVFFGALAYGVYMFLLRVKASGVTIIPPDEPARLQPAPPPVTLNAVPVGSRYTVQR